MVQPIDSSSDDDETLCNENAKENYRSKRSVRKPKRYCTTSSESPTRRKKEKKIVDHKKDVTDIKKLI